MEKYSAGWYFFSQLTSKRKWIAIQHLETSTLQLERPLQKRPLSLLILSGSDGHGGDHMGYAKLYGIFFSSSRRLGACGSDSADGALACGVRSDASFCIHHMSVIQP